MNILLIAYYYMPIENAGTIRPAKMAKYLSMKGHNVTVLTCSYSGSNIIEEGLIRVKDEGYNNDRRGVKMVKWSLRRFRTEILNIAGKYSSIFDNWKKNVFKFSDSIHDISKPDLIISTYPPVETLETGIYLSGKFDIPLITDFRDGLIYDPIERKNLRKFKSIKSHYEKLESEALRYSKSVTSFSEPHTVYLKNKYDKKEIYTILNGYDEDDFLSLPEKTSLKKREINIVFTGRIELSYKYNKITPFINAIRNLIKTEKNSANKLRFHFAGELTVRERKLMDDLIENGIFMLYGHVDRATSLSMQRDSDALLIFSQHNRESAVPLKYFEYIYWKKHVIALTKNNFLEELMNSNGSGSCLDPENEKEIYRFFSELLKDQKNFLQSYRPVDNIKKYSISEQFSILNELIKQGN